MRVRGRVMIGLLIAAGALPASLYLLQHHEGMNVCVMTDDWHRDGASLKRSPPLHEESFKQRLNRYRPKEAGIMGGQLLIEKFTEV